MRTVGHYKEQRVGLDTFYMRQTYGEFLFFSKDDLPTMNQSIIHERLKNNIERIFGKNRPIFVALDEGLDLSLKKKLPPITCYAWLTSYKPIKDESKIYSYLILVWFQNEEENPFDVLSQKLKGIDWEQHAKDASP